MNGTELKTESLQRWVMYSKEVYGSGRIFLTTEQKQAVEGGKKFSQHAYADVWARDAALVQRVRSFLGTSFHWHEQLAKNGADLEVVETLRSMIRGESVVLIAERSNTGGAWVDRTPRSKRFPSFREELMTKLGMSYDAATAYIDRYNDMVDRANAVVSRYEKEAASSLTGAASEFTETTTRLGDAQPFELGDFGISDNVQEIAATDRDSMYACDVITAECKGSVLREFPGQYLNSTLGDIQSDANDGVKEARKALKLLNDNRFKK
ncbi:hypothetical protein [Paraburkholderia aspalathi]|uniref:hypothetical protein n=1 Tax=Paraburkholderia aspalathi TaxID=1324617 RepID=UPI0038B7B642